MDERTCKVEGCGNGGKLRRGMCDKHYARWRLHGDPNIVKKGRKLCSIEGCDTKHFGRGLCMKHYTRWRVHGDPLTLRNPWYQNGFISYISQHRKIRKLRGHASSYPCDLCGKQARQWAYDYTDPDEIVDESQGRRVVYSLDIDRYFPLCVSCHRLYDGAYRRLMQTGRAS